MNGTGNSVSIYKYNNSERGRVIVFDYNYNVWG